MPPLDQLDTALQDAGDLGELENLGEPVRGGARRRLKLGATCDLDVLDLRRADAASREQYGQVDGQWRRMPVAAPVDALTLRPPGPEPVPRPSRIAVLCPPAGREGGARMRLRMRAPPHLRSASVGAPERQPRRARLARRARERRDLVGADAGTGRADRADDPADDRRRGHARPAEPRRAQLRAARQRRADGRPAPRRRGLPGRAAPDELEARAVAGTRLARCGQCAAVADHAAAPRARRRRHRRGGLAGRLPGARRAARARPRSAGQRLGAHQRRDAGPSRGRAAAAVRHRGDHLGLGRATARAAGGALPAHCRRDRPDCLPARTCGSAARCRWVGR